MADDDVDDVIQDELKARRKRLIIASRTPRTKEEINKALAPFKKYKIDWIMDDREVTITREFEVTITDPDNNKLHVRQIATLTVSGNLHRPIEDFVYDARWLLSQAGAIQDAQKTISVRRKG